MKGTDKVYPDGFTTNGGMTIREHFASLAMQGLLANGDILSSLVAKKAVETADALIEELNKPKK